MQRVYRTAAGLDGSRLTLAAPPEASVWYHRRMSTGRIEAFSDGVIAVIITIMVLDLHAPHDGSWASFAQLGPGFAIYILSFLLVGILWMNHHHMLHVARAADGRLLWSNLALLFAMSLIPFSTAYVANTNGAPLAVAAYAISMGLASASFSWVIATIAMQQPPDVAPRFRVFIRKGVTVTLLYIACVGFAFVSVVISYVIFVAIPIFYVIPDRAAVE